MRGKRLLITGVVVLAGTGSLALLRHRAMPSAVPAPAPKVAQLPLGEAALSGTIRAQHVVSVGAAIDGNIEAFLVDSGQEVSAGQLLARISNQGLETAREMANVAYDNAQARLTKIEAQLTAVRLEASRASADAVRARSGLDRAERTYLRQRMLFGEGATPRLVFEKSERDYQAAKTEWASADVLARQTDERVRTEAGEVAAARRVADDKHKQLEEAVAEMTTAEVHSPVDGTVVARQGDVGKPARQFGNDLFQIATDLLALSVAVEPPPPVLARVKPGQPALVLIPDFQAEGIPASVLEIQGTVVLVGFNSPNPALKPGLNAQVRIKLD